MMMKGGAVPANLQAWEEKQKQLKKQGMDQKEISNISLDKQRNSDLTALTEQVDCFNNIINKIFPSGRTMDQA